MQINIYILVHLRSINLEHFFVAASRFFTLLQINYLGPNFMGD